MTERSPTQDEIALPPASARNWQTCIAKLGTSATGTSLPKSDSEGEKTWNSHTILIF